MLYVRMLCDYLREQMVRLPQRRDEGAGMRDEGEGVRKGG